MLAYILARFINFPAQEIPIQLPGVYLPLSLNINSVVAVFVIGLTGSGVDWLLRGHPAIENKATYQHWLLPTLTAWAIGITLLQQPLGPLWWGGFGLGSGILILVVVAEYITVDPSDIRRVPAMIGLTAVAFALYLVLAIVVRSRGARLFITVPTITLATGLISLRVLLLQLQGRWAIAPTLIAMLIAGQITAALYYLPLSPVQFALILVGFSYALLNVIVGVMEKKNWQQLIAEPLFIFIFTWVILIWLH